MNLTEEGDPSVKSVSICFQFILCCKILCVLRHIPTQMSRLGNYIILFGIEAHFCVSLKVVICPCINVTWDEHENGSVPAQDALTFRREGAKVLVFCISSLPRLSSCGLER